jgi:hypothetical protein
VGCVFANFRARWTRDSKGIAIDFLRIGIGLVWTFNLIFILAPSNQFFAGFQSVAGGFGSTTLGGPGLATFVATYPGFFAWTIAVLTGYLAVAFLAGITTRLACLVGGAASVAFLLTQFTSTFALDGSGTDVGAHPLYLLIYLILFVGGAGQYLAVDRWVWASGHANFPRLSRWLASPRGSSPGPTAAKFPIRSTDPEAERTAGGYSAAGSLVGQARVVIRRPKTARMADQNFFNVTTAIVLLLVFVVGGLALSAEGTGSPAPTAPGAVSYLNLTIDLNATTGWPQYSPANFTVAAGEVRVTITDHDAAMPWPGCTCNVTGTVGGLETINDTSVSELSSSNIAHSFDVPSLGINVLSPGGSVVAFTLFLNQSGTFTWFCEAPCGADGYTGAPMGVSGYMTGTMSVV